MRQLLQDEYGKLCSTCKLEVFKHKEDINSIVKTSICSFIKKCNNPAIWCYGKHTQMLMSDFMFEMKKVHYIIDNEIKNRKDSGFSIIDESMISPKNIDGIIISSRQYKEEIIENLKTNYKGIPYLDIYTELEKAGIHLKTAYYAVNHPYNRYCNLNKMQMEYSRTKNVAERRSTLKKIIDNYIDIKDFKSAIKYTKQLIELSPDGNEETLLRQLEKIYRLQIESFKKIDNNNVIMLCIDGLRRKDVSKECMKELYDFAENKMHFYTNAYSVSTSTYESLIPAYCENDNLKTKYYESNKVISGNCRFINEAKKQNRKIHFYTDGVEYIEDDTIKVKQQAQTASEKLWDFMLDAVDEKNGLFYIHILYESHYSYPNPYTRNKIVAEGTNIMFDYLDKNGGQIRTDYNSQHKDSLKYLDDVIIPLIKNLKCRMVLYADHGNILIDEGTALENIEKTKYTFHEDLIQIPFGIKSPELEPVKDNSLISIMELNNILISLMNQKQLATAESEFIKVVRSELYNPDFKYLYKKADNQQGLLAFEVFIFKNSYKLAVYADGSVELYLSETDHEVHDIQKRKQLYEKIKDKITVCDM